jgi:hypothetical protein
MLTYTTDPVTKQTNQNLDLLDATAIRRPHPVAQRRG